MNFIQILTLSILLVQSCYAQAYPGLEVLSGQEYHERALRFEAERSKYLLNLDTLIQKLKSPEKKTIIDLRDAESYRTKHLKGAINIPIELLTKEKLDSVVPDKSSTIIIYCNNSFYPTRMIALTIYGYPTLRSFGYTNVYDVAPLWKMRADLPNELEPYWEK